MTKAEQQGSKVMDGLLLKDMTVEQAKRTALKQLSVISESIPKVKGAEVTMKPQLDHVEALRIYFESYEQ